MKPKILRLARDDIREIHERLVEFGNIPPKKFRESFEKFCANVTTMPFMYAQYELNPKYRRAVIAYDYIVFYQTEEINGKTISKVYRVLHGKRDIKHLLDSEID